jgi:hypothetical protein
LPSSKEVIGVKRCSSSWLKQEPFLEVASRPMPHLELVVSSISCRVEEVILRKRSFGKE